MLNLFLAILLDNFDEESISSEVMKKLEKEKALNKLKKPNCYKYNKLKIKVWCRKKMGLQQKKRKSKTLVMIN